MFFIVGKCYEYFVHPAKNLIKYNDIKYLYIVPWKVANRDVRKI
jgi:hypothetical protein